MSSSFPPDNNPFKEPDNSMTDQDCQRIIDNSEKLFIDYYESYQTFQTFINASANLMLPLSISSSKTRLINVLVNPANNAVRRRARGVIMDDYLVHSNEQNSLSHNETQDLVKTTQNNQRQKLDEATQDIINEILKIKANIKIELDEAFKNLLQANFDELAQRMDSLSDLFKSYADNLNNLFQTLINKQDFFLDRLGAMSEDVIAIKKFFPTLENQLKDCCNELLAEIKEIKTFFIEISNDLETIKNLVNNYGQKLDQINTSLVDFKKGLDNFEQLMSSKLETLNQKLNDFESTFTNFLNQFFDLVKLVNNLQTLLNTHVQEFRDYRRNAENQLNDITTGINTIESRTSRLLTGQDEIITNLNAGFLAISGLFGDLNTALTLAVGTILTGVGGVVEAALTPTALKLDSIQNSIDQLPQKFQQILEKEFDKFKDSLFEKLDTYWEDHKKNILPDITNNVCENVVGASYSRWDSQCSYYPTLMFKFVSKENIGFKRHSQIAIRLPILSENITTAIVEELKIKVNQIVPLEYESGSLRCNYVNLKKTFKTTIYVSSKDIAFRLLKIFSDLIDETFLENQCSFTEKNLRQSITRRSQSLGSIPVNLEDKREINVLTIQRVYLQINILQRQELIYTNPLF